jgi:hypothetical protein
MADKIVLHEARLVPRLTIRRITFNLTRENRIFLISYLYLCLYVSCW